MINKEFNSILELIQTFSDEQTCIDHLTEMRWKGNVVSPFDPESKVYVCKGNKYKCKNTGKYFNVKTATLFDNSKVKLQTWFIAIWLITGHKKGIASTQLAKELGVTQKTAWFMLQRIRACFGVDDDSKIGQDFPVEADETYIGGKNKNRHEDKKIKNDSGHKSKTTIVGMIERHGLVKAEKIDGPTKKNLHGALNKNVELDATVFTDELKAYSGIEGEFGHETVNHKAKQWKRGDVHTNNIEAFWSLLKRGLYGTYHWVSDKHMKKYVDEFTFRYNSRNCNEDYRMNFFLGHTETRTTYKQLIHG